MLVEKSKNATGAVDEEDIELVEGLEAPREGEPRDAVEGAENQQDEIVVQCACCAVLATWKGMSWLHGLDLVASIRMFSLCWVVVECLEGPPLILVLPFGFWLFFEAAYKCCFWGVSMSTTTTAILQCIWFPFSFLLTLLAGATALGFALFLFTEPDGQLVFGREVVYSVSMLTAAACFLSLLCQIALLVCAIKLLCCGNCASTSDSALLCGCAAYSPCCLQCCRAVCTKFRCPQPSPLPLQAPAPSPDDAPRRLGSALGLSFRALFHEPRVDVRTVGFVTSALLALLGFIFVVIATHLTLAYSVYATDKNVDYSHCEPMLATGPCAVPFPSSHWLEPDTTSLVTGVRIRMAPNTLPYTKRGAHLTPNLMNTMDGFSLLSPLLWHLDNEVVMNSQLVPFTDIAKSLLSNSTTLLLHVESGELHPHFSEVDKIETLTDSLDEKDAPTSTQLSYMMPATTLLPNATYVAVVKGLTGSGGRTLAATARTAEYVTAYLGGSTSTVAGDARYDRFAASGGAFPLLESLGVNLDDVQLLWDFRTASTNTSQTDLQNMKRLVEERMDAALAQDPTGAGLWERTMDMTEKGFCAGGYYRLSVPWFLESEKAAVGRAGDEFDFSLLDGSAADVPMVSKAGRIGAFIGVPCSYTSSTTPSTRRGLLEYGHGLFEDYAAPDRWTWMHNIAWYSSSVVWGINWRGMSRFQLLDCTATLMWNNNGLMKVRAGLLQTFAAKVAALRLVRIILQQHEEKFGIQGLLPAPADLPSRYLGVSLGSIIGGGYVPYMQYERSVFFIGGACFSFIFGRSALFVFYRVIMDQQYYSRADMRLAMTTWQTMVDMFETSGWTRKFDGQSPWRSLEALSAIANGDSTVTTIAGRIQARAFNATMLGPALFDAFELPQTQGPVDTTDLVTNNRRVLFNTEYANAADNIPKSSKLPEPSFVHNCLPQNWFIEYQAGAFVSTGVVADYAMYCTGAAPCGLDNSGLENTQPECQGY